MQEDRVTHIYDRLPQLVVDLDPDPAGRGVAYLQDLISKVRGFLNETSVYLQEVIRHKSQLESELEALRASFEISSNELMVNDDRVKRLPSIQDRTSMINVILRDEYRLILDKKQQVSGVSYVEKAVRHRHKELESTMSAIRLQRSLLQSDRVTGSCYGDESSVSRGDTWKSDIDVESGVDLSSDELDKLLADVSGDSDFDVVPAVAEPEPKAELKPESVPGSTSNIEPENNTGVMLEFLNGSDGSDNDLDDLVSSVQSASMSEDEEDFSDILDSL